MERASTALVRTDYFGAERACLRALLKAVAAADWERAARVCMPLQEARRQKRMLAIDATGPGGARLVSRAEPVTAKTGPGCWLFQPPLVALDARRFREAADQREIPVFVMTREPMTRAGEWPVVAVVGQLSVRVRIAPPPGVRPAPGGMSAAHPTGDEVAGPVPIEWFTAAAEALGDSAIARLNPEDPAAHRALDCIDFLDAFPDHEKLHQRLEIECRRAASEPPPVMLRRRPSVQDAYAF
ncbi:MAG: hypothetical protein IT436_09490 [Phycisphaerales bacterium]|nr:hypothetical protein [Phycisphaerales bacterium]